MPPAPAPAFLVPAGPLRAVDGRLLLRPWELGDAGALAAAWSDPEISLWCTVPADPSTEAAAHWISGWQRRVDLGLALDFVIADPASGEVLGEVGLRRLARPASHCGPGVLELGWWVGGEHRRARVGSTAVALLADWARPTLGMQLVARIPDGHRRSERIAAAAGMNVRGPLPCGQRLWACPPP